MLEVERGQDADSGGQDFLNVLVALGVLYAKDVPVGHFVDQAKLGRLGQDAWRVRLLQLGAAVDEAPPLDWRLGDRGQYHPEPP